MGIRLPNKPSPIGFGQGIVLIQLSSKTKHTMGVYHKL